MTALPAADALRADGFVRLPALLDPAELAAAQSLCLAEWHDFNRSDRRWFGGGSLLGHLNYQPPPNLALFGHWVQNPALIAMIHAILGHDACLLSWGGNLNKPGSAFQPPHTDGLMDQSYLIVNIPLGDVDESNGATELYPGSHHHVMRYPQFRAKFAARAIRATSRNGDVLLRFPNLWHRGAPNRSQRPRMMLAAIFGPGDQAAPPIALSEDNARLFEQSGLRGRIEVSDRLTGNFAQNYFARSARGIAKELLCRHALWLYNAMRR